MKINVEENKRRFIELLANIDRPEADIAGFIYKLEHSDFFEAPCSTKYHLNVKGGLVAHLLSVRDIAFKLKEIMYPNNDAPFSDTSLEITALCHDMDKMNKYIVTSRNVKDYCDDGKYSDSLGKFNWKSEEGYAIKDAKERFTYGHHGQNSEYITSTFIPLKFEESVAITNHMAGDDEYKPYDLTAIFNKFPLASILHTADFLSTFVVENFMKEDDE